MGFGMPSAGFPPGTAVPGWPPRDHPASSLPSCGQLVAIGFLGLFVLAVIGAIVVQAMIGGMGGPRPTSQPAPVSWTSRDVDLDPATARVEGRVVLSWQGSADSITAGVNAGAPVAAPARPDAAADGSATPGRARAGSAPPSVPAIPLTDPPVRLTVRATGFERSCDAPCEIPLPSPSCTNEGPCSVDAAVTLELGAVASARPVSVPLFAGVSAPMDGRLPSGVSVSIELGVAPSPGAGG